jgi:hypothetical protein
MWLDLRGRFVESMSEGIAGLVAAGRARPLDAPTAAAALSAMVEWFAFTTLVVGDPADQDIPAAAAALADLWVHAVDRDG